jgi:hypothetical protein
VSVWQQKEEWGMEEEDENIHGSELLDMFWAGIYIVLTSFFLKTGSIVPVT